MDKLQRRILLSHGELNDPSTAKTSCYCFLCLGSLHHTVQRYGKANRCGSLIRTAYKGRRRFALAEASSGMCQSKVGLPRDSVVLSLSSYLPGLSASETDL